MDDRSRGKDGPQGALPLNGFLDTSVVVRYLTGDPPEMAVKAARMIDRVDGLLVTGVVLSETAHVLTSVYKLPRQVAVDYLIELLSKSNITLFGLDKGLVIQGLLMCKPSGRISFDDALVWAAARSSGKNVVYSFDRRFPSDGLEIIAVSA